MKSKVSCLLLLLSVVLFSFLTLFAQSKSVSNSQITSPSNEKFQPVNYLIAPWKRSTCHQHPAKKVFQRENCPDSDKAKSQKEDMKLYNSDGSLWKQLGIDYINKPSNYYIKQPQEEFLPFFSYGDPAIYFVLRLVGESEHWYEVEINENTRATKFVLKSDQMWLKQNLQDWLAIEPLEITKEQSILFDKPNGEIIEETRGQDFKYVDLLKLDGDWAYVRKTFYNPDKTYEGWIRWQEDRRMLVGSFLNKTLSRQYMEKWRLPPTIWKQYNRNSKSN